MKLLAVDTALGACSCALMDDARVLAHRFEVMERGHAERLAPMVQEVMADAGVEFAQVARLAVTTGPGTFTGQRVGLSFMRGMRVALKIPLTGVTTLEAMARAAMAQTGQPFGAALHDAKRNEVYVELLNGDVTMISARIATLEEAVAALSEAVGNAPLCLAGTAAQAASVLYPGATTVTDIRQPDALWVGRIARTKEVTAEAPAPLYLRPPDAKLPAPRT